MGEKIIVGPLNKGLRNDVTPFVIDNDSFPVLENAYQWRGRVKRKRGTFLIGRLTRYFNSTISSYGSITSFNLAGGAGNLLSAFGLQADGNIIPGTVALRDNTAGNNYTDNSLGVLTGAPAGTGTINYATGAITIAGGASNTINTVSFRYYPDLPALGERDFIDTNAQFPKSIGFDQVYSYNVGTVAPYPIYDVSFYKNPPTGTYTNYVQKTNITPTSWNGQNYQQFWTVNYQGAMWATNGVPVPFDSTNIGMQFKPIVAVTVTSGTTASLQITGHGLVIGDFLFINEVSTTTGINFQTGYVTTVTDANNVVVTFPNATIATNGTGGIAQYLTSRSSTTKDCIRWYDGDPTNGSSTTPVLNGRKGWVNFCPPLSQLAFPTGDLPRGQYYLVGAKLIMPFKGRLMFLGPVVQTSGGSPIYLGDTVIFSQSGAAFYTASYTGDPLLPTTTFNPILVPTNQAAASSAWFEDSFGFGGYESAGTDQNINTVGSNQDVLLIGINTAQTKFVYTGNDIQPFQFFTVNTELGSSSTFSAINMDRGTMTIGTRGIIITTQVSSERLDLEIPDEIFQMNLNNNGLERICSQRDYVNEWCYFTYRPNYNSTLFPSQTLQYNYRDQSWAIFKESFTSYGIFRETEGYTWATIGQRYPTWASWNNPWNAGASTSLQPQVIGGNQQGFLLVRDEGTGEGFSLYIQSISGNVITSPDHGLNENDFVYIAGCIGTVSPTINGRIFQAQSVTNDTFFAASDENPPLVISGTYLGGGLIKRLYRPFIQTKQFPVSWGMMRKTRLGVQQYLLSATDSAQITLLIFLSQNANDPRNAGGVIPDISTNNSLIYSSVLFTCPEAENIGLTPANINLQMPGSAGQAQIWHRMNTSLIGDTVQIGFTLSDAQMYSYSETGNVLVITGATQANPCVLSCVNELTTPLLVRIENVGGMIELNDNTYRVISLSSTTVTIDVDASAFTAYTSGGTATELGIVNQFAEIELHSFILDVNPGPLLA